MSAFISALPGIFRLGMAGARAILGSSAARAAGAGVLRAGRALDAGVTRAGAAASSGLASGGAKAGGAVAGKVGVKVGRTIGLGTAKLGGMAFGPSPRHGLSAGLGARIGGRFGGLTGARIGRGVGRYAMPAATLAAIATPRQRRKDTLPAVKVDRADLLAKASPSAAVRAVVGSRKVRMALVGAGALAAADAGLSIGATYARRKLIDDSVHKICGTGVLGSGGLVLDRPLEKTFSFAAPPSGGGHALHPPGTRPPRFNLTPRFNFLPRRPSAKARPKSIKLVHHDYNSGSLGGIGSALAQRARTEGMVEKLSKQFSLPSNPASPGFFSRVFRAPTANAPLVGYKNPGNEYASPGQMHLEGEEAPPVSPYLQ